MDAQRQTTARDTLPRIAPFKKDPTHVGRVIVGERIPAAGLPCKPRPGRRQVAALTALPSIVEFTTEGWFGTDVDPRMDEV